ncbi:MCE family protein [Planomonospora sp. ID67723]|uniref:MCE family protein n=1 Tax=Planomonospora sp. ID67723 TaxID=2738134 RepID=UPI0018C44D79|nr:MlaD family protein [Planomonospora sp. ID67723]MBG0829643.1 MCE family protein [Planomonospora sp. ID67723]
MRSRIWINLGFFAVLGVVMTVWAFTSIIKLDIIERPYRINAEFVSSPGLVRGFDVAYLGVRIGRIDDVALAPGKIVVALSIDREVRIPRGVTAEVRRKSAIGEPYVEISPPKAGAAGGGTMPPGATIPLASTSVPLDYRKLFDGVGKLLNAVPPEDAQTIVRELAAALDGRTTSIREIVDNAHDLTTTLADNTDLLDELSVNLTRLTGTLAGKREELSQGVTDLAGVTRSIRDSRKQLYAMLDHGPGFFRQVDRLLNSARPGLSCTLTAAGMRQGVVFTPQTRAHINHVLRTVPTAQALLADVTERHSGGLYGRVTFIFSVPGGPRVAQEYRGPLAPPATPALRACPKGAPVPPVNRADDDPDTGPHPDDAAGPVDGTTDAPDGEATASPPESEGPLEAEDTEDRGGRTTAEGTGADAGSAPQDYTPFVVATFLAVVVSGGVLGWIAVGRATRRREQESDK